MIKLLIGGSPCTYWSIAQKNNRETKAEGLGWELFKNYLVAKERFKPDFFLYENNKSASQAIKDQIKKELKVYDGTLLMEDTGARYIEINSALVSAQNRQRFYVHNCGDVKQPEDRGILLKDILESGENLTQGDKSFALTTRCVGGIPEDTIQKHRHTMVAEPICVQEQVFGRKAQADGSYDRRYEARIDGESGTVTGTNRQNAIAEPVIFQTPRGKNNGGCKYGKSPTLTANGSWQDNNHIIEPIRVGALPHPNGELSTSQAMRIYSVDAKSVTQSAGGSGMGGKTGLYAVPVENVGDCETIQNAIPKLAEKYGYLPEQFNSYNLAEITDKSSTLTTGSMVTSSCATTIFEKTDKPIYEVKDGLITIKGKQYPIKLADGFYIIRKLTVTECARLQTMPDNYCKAVSICQAYKGIGNGWTAEVIIHILNGALKNVPKDEKIVVLSMYDGIGTGRYCLDKMGFTNVEYHAYEIDKYAIKIAMSNYPDIIQHGDAFALRNDNWSL